MGGVFPAKILLDFLRKAILRMVTEAVRGSYTFQHLGFQSEQKVESIVEKIREEKRNRSFQGCRLRSPEQRLLFPEMIPQLAKQNFLGN